MVILCFRKGTASITLNLAVSLLESTDTNIFCQYEFTMDNEKSEAEAHVTQDVQQNGQTSNTLTGIRVYLIFASLTLAAFLVSLNGSIVSTVFPKPTHIEMKICEFLISSPLGHAVYHE
jgi:hypothetical protein